YDPSPLQDFCVAD
nr:RecName: Full=Germin GS1 [Hordeum vulgare]